MGARQPSENRAPEEGTATPSSHLSPYQIARARSRTYDLLGRLSLTGLTAEELPYVAEISELAATLSDHFEADEAAADHQQLFGFNVFPHESIFLDPSGLLGGPIADAILLGRQRAGFVRQIDSDMVDHLGQELKYLALLSDHEARARQDGSNDIVRRMAGLQREFLDQHLLRWLPALLVAIEKQGQRFYNALIHLVFDLSLAHRADLSSTPAPEFVLPDPPALLTQKGTGLKEIAAYLLAPPYSGIYLSRDDIGRLARRQELPRGFGNRQQMLLNLWRSAAMYDGLETSIEALQDFVSSWFDTYDQLRSDPQLRPFVTAWRSRTAATISLLTEMHANIREFD